MFGSIREKPIIGLAAQQAVANSNPVVQLRKYLVTAMTHKIETQTVMAITLAQAVDICDFRNTDIVGCVEIKVMLPKEENPHESKTN